MKRGSRVEECWVLVPGIWYDTSDKRHKETIPPLEQFGSGDSSVVRASDSRLKGRGLESLQERRENFLLQDQLSVLTHISVSVPLPVLPQ